MDALPHPLPAWPYPRWIAHRGAGKLAPENTLAALQLGVHYGYRMFECDVKLSADGVAFLMHDADLARTVRGLPPGLLPSAPTGDQPWQVLSQLDAGSWHSARYAGEPLPTLAQIASFCLKNSCMLNIEIKPVPGTEARTGQVVADTAAQLWAGTAVPPLLSSFQVAALQAAQRAQPQLPRALLLDAWRDDWLVLAHSLGCVAVVCQHSLWSAAAVAQAKRAGLRTLSYTVNDEAVAQQLLAWDTDGIITDRVDRFDPRG